MRNRAFCFKILLICALTVSAQESDKIKADAGMIYTEWISNSDSALCRISMKAPLKKSKNSDPLQIFFLMDYWASVEIGRIVSNSASSVGLINLINDGDFFSAISFSKTGKTISSLKEMNDSNRKDAKNEIRNAKIVEGANLSAGLKKLEEQINENGSRDNSGRHAFIICSEYSDGSMYLQDVETIRYLSEEFGLTFSTFGHYKGFNEDYLIEIAKSTGGRSFFVEKNEIKELEEKINSEISRVSNSSVKDISLSLSLPGDMEIKRVDGAMVIEEELLINSFKSGTTNYLYMTLFNKPEKRRDITIDIGYTDHNNVSDYNELFYLELPINGSGKTFDRDHAPSLLVYDTHQKLQIMSEKIQKGVKNYRQVVADTLKNRILKLEESNNSLDSSLLKSWILKFTEFKDDLNNYAIESEIIVKRIKYHLLDFIYEK